MLEQPKDDGFTGCGTLAFAAPAPRPEVRLIGLDRSGQGRATGAVLGQAHTDTRVDIVGVAQADMAKSGRIGSGQVQGKQAQQLTELGLTDFGAAVVSVFTNNLNKLSCVTHMFAS
jgi:hypothetical protein